MFATRGLAADRIAELAWILTYIAIAVTVVVTAAVVIALVRRRAARTSDIVGDLSDTATFRWVVVGGAVAPALIIAGVFVYTVLVQGAIASPPTRPAMTVHIVGHRWWWDVAYDVDGAVGGVHTPNELHLPIGEPVRVELDAHDVIHSFWVPQLAGKTDVIPGQTNVMWIEARVAGTYRGECAEYCGAQHTNMNLAVVAEDSARFRSWLADQRANAAVPRDSEPVTGAHVFAQLGCQACHMLRGKPTAGVEGPDLTHVASRLMLGAGLMSNNPGNMAGWVSNAPALKPGIEMPAVAMSAGQMRALLAYLEVLR
jgi:cytochrome c oxidase subunit 2